MRDSRTAAHRPIAGHREPRLLRRSGRVAGELRPAWSSPRAREFRTGPACSAPPSRARPPKRREDRRRRPPLTPG